MPISPDARGADKRQNPALPESRRRYVLGRSELVELRLLEDIAPWSTPAYGRAAGIPLAIET